MTQLYIIYAARGKKVGGGSVRRHWALLLSNDGGLSGQHCHVVNSGLGGGPMKYEHTEKFNIADLGTYYTADRKVLISDVKEGVNPATVVATIGGVPFPDQKFVDNEYLPDCQDWVRDVVGLLVEENMINRDLVTSINEVPSRE